MISVQEARKILGDNLIEFGTREVELMDSSDCIIAEDIFADRDFPPYERVTMDGIALDSLKLREGRREFEIEHLQAAGAEKSSLSDPQNAIEVMTGAILPVNTDAVVRYEDLEMIEEGGRKVAKVLIDSVDPYKNVHRMGEDRRKGDLLIRAGTKISPPEIAVMATAGKSVVKVYEFPGIAIVSTGDELVDIEETPDEHQIRKSNVYAILSEVRSMGIRAELFHLQDDKEALETRLGEILVDFPVLILSGGVSKGKLDFVPEILEKLGIRKHFHKVSQRPGKPLWFGSSEKNVVFALPGNPVSTYMCFLVYVKSWLLNCLNLAPVVEYASLDTDATFKPNLTYFIQVKIYINKNSKLMATPVIGHGSGDLANLLDVDGFLELPIGQTIYNRGSSFPFHRFRYNNAVPNLDPQSSQKG